MKSTPDLAARARARLGAGMDKITESVRPGPAERAVAEEAKSKYYDLVIVPPAGRNAIQRMLMGSRVATIVRNLPASVLIARRTPPVIRNILAAVSGGANSAPVVRKSSELARSLGATLTFIYIRSDVPVPGNADGNSDEGLDAVRELLKSHAENATLLIRDGFIVDEILREMDTGAHDLLIAGAPSSPKSESWARENVVERILLQCPAPILVAR